MLVNKNLIKKLCFFETIPSIWFSLSISDEPRFGRARAAPAVIPTD
jgi:hypothetical protein